MAPQAFDRHSTAATTGAVEASAQSLRRIAATISRDGYAFVGADEMSSLLGERSRQTWATFQDSWHNLGMDIYMADGGRYRRRRLAAFAVSTAGIHRKSHQPHYQSRDYNPLNGGIVRWFEPLTAEVAASPVLTAALSTCNLLFNCLTPEHIRPANWHVEVHQFRIEARAGQSGHPTPEKTHRDGVDWIFVLLIARANIVQGTTIISDDQSRPIGNFTITQPFDAVFIDDHRVLHGVTPVEAANFSQPAYRDVLVITFRQSDDPAS